MAAVDDLTELVERAAAAEMSALASKWKERFGCRGPHPQDTHRS